MPFKFLAFIIINSFLFINAYVIHIDKIFHVYYQ